jgi:hypothetical protein
MPPCSVENLDRSLPRPPTPTLTHTGEGLGWGLNSPGPRFSTEQCPFNFGPPPDRLQHNIKRRSHPRAPFGLGGAGTPPGLSRFTTLEPRFASLSKARPVTEPGRQSQPRAGASSSSTMSAHLRPRVRAGRIRGCHLQQRYALGQRECLPRQLVPHHRRRDRQHRHPEGRRHELPGEFGLLRRRHPQLRGGPAPPARCRSSIA